MTSTKNDEAIRKALLVMVTTRETRAWLAEHDPKALQQAEAALKGSPELEAFFTSEREAPPKKPSPKIKKLLDEFRQAIIAPRTLSLGLLAGDVRYCEQEERRLEAAIIAAWDELAAKTKR